MFVTVDNIVNTTHQCIYSPVRLIKLNQSELEFGAKRRHKNKQTNINDYFRFLCLTSLFFFKDHSRLHQLQPVLIDRPGHQTKRWISADQTTENQTRAGRRLYTQFIMSDCAAAGIDFCDLERLATNRISFRQLTSARTFHCGYRVNSARQTYRSHTISLDQPQGVLFVYFYRILFE